MSSSEEFIKLIKHPVKFRMFLFSKIPAAFFSGVKVVEMDESKSVVSIPFTKFTTNPFRSTYFACLAMAAEMSTGSLAMMHLYQRTPPVSMLITKMEAVYHKKATDKTIFTCTAGEQIKKTIEQAIVLKEPKDVTVRSIGKNRNDELIAEFFFTWSFKVRGV